jgi:ethanolamine utilization microcompartment shell protein EutS
MENSTKSTNSRENLAVAITSSAVAPATIMGISSPFANHSEGRISNTMDPSMIANLVDNFSDVLVISGDLVAVSDNLDQVNITARDFIYEPKVLDIVTSGHAPFKVAVNVATVAFDANGVATDGVNSVTQFAVETATNLPLVGYAFRVQAADTQRGLAQIDVTCSSGTSVRGDLGDIGASAWLVILNHKADTSATYNTAVNYSAGKFQVTETDITVSNQFTFSPSGNATAWTLKGVNANVTVYPIVADRDTQALIQGLYYADRTEELAQTLLLGYQG